MASFVHPKNRFQPSLSQTSKQGLVTKYELDPSPFVAPNGTIAGRSILVHLSTAINQNLNGDLLKDGILLLEKPGSGASNSEQEEYNKVQAKARYQARAKVDFSVDGAEMTFEEVMDGNGNSFNPKQYKFKQFGDGSQDAIAKAAAKGWSKSENKVLDESGNPISDRPKLCLELDFSKNYSVPGSAQPKKTLLQHFVGRDNATLRDLEDIRLVQTATAHEHDTANENALAAAIAGTTSTAFTDIDYVNEYVDATIKSAVWSKVGPTAAGGDGKRKLTIKVQLNNPEQAGILEHAAGSTADELLKAVVHIERRNDRSGANLSYDNPSQNIAEVLVADFVKASTDPADPDNTFIVEVHKKSVNADRGLGYGPLSAHSQIEFAVQFASQIPNPAAVNQKREVGMNWTQPVSMICEARASAPTPITDAHNNGSLPVWTMSEGSTSYPQLVDTSNTIGNDMRRYQKTGSGSDVLCQVAAMWHMESDQDTIALQNRTNNVSDVEKLRLKAGLVTGSGSSTRFSTVNGMTVESDLDTSDIISSSTTPVKMNNATQKADTRMLLLRANVTAAMIGDNQSVKVGMAVVRKGGRYRDDDDTTSGDDRDEEIVGEILVQTVNNPGAKPEVTLSYESKNATIDWASGTQTINFKCTNIKANSNYALLLKGGRQAGDNLNAVAPTNPQTGQVFGYSSSSAGVTNVTNPDVGAYAQFDSMAGGTAHSSAAGGHAAGALQNNLQAPGSLTAFTTGAVATNRAPTVVYTADDDNGMTGTLTGTFTIKWDVDRPSNTFTKLVTAADNKIRLCLLETDCNCSNFIMCHFSSTSNSDAFAPYWIKNAIMNTAGFGLREIYKPQAPPELFKVGTTTMNGMEDASVKVRAYQAFESADESKSVAQFIESGQTNANTFFEYNPSTIPSNMGAESQWNITEDNGSKVSGGLKANQTGKDLSPGLVTASVVYQVQPNWTNIGNAGYTVSGDGAYDVRKDFEEQTTGGTLVMGTKGVGNDSSTVTQTLKLPFKDGGDGFMCVRAAKYYQSPSISSVTAMMSPDETQGNGKTKSGYLKAIYLEGSTRGSICGPVADSRGNHKQETGSFSMMAFSEMSRLANDATWDDHGRPSALQDDQQSHARIVFRTETDGGQVTLPGGATVTLVPLKTISTINTDLVAAGDDYISNSTNSANDGNSTGTMRPSYLFKCMLYVSGNAAVPDPGTMTPPLKIYPLQASDGHSEAEGLNSASDSKLLCLVQIKPVDAFQAFVVCFVDPARNFVSQTTAHTEGKSRTDEILPTGQTATASGAVAAAQIRHNASGNVTGGTKQQGDVVQIL